VTTLALFTGVASLADSDRSPSSRRVSSQWNWPPERDRRDPECRAGKVIVFKEKAARMRMLVYVVSPVRTPTIA